MGDQRTVRGTSTHGKEPRLALDSPHPARRPAEPISPRFWHGHPLLPQPARFRHMVFRSALQAGRCADLAPVRLESFARTPLPIARDEKKFVEWVLESAGLDVTRYRLATLQRRLPACLRAVQVGSLSEARTVLEQHPELIERAVEAIIIGFTGFFRDPPVFGLLRRHLQASLAFAHGGRRIWSVGCSDGAELYSVAILLAEMGGLAGARLLGTDCRPPAIRRARAGYFEPYLTRQLREPRHRRYFEIEAARSRVVPALRDAVQWRIGDVFTGMEVGEWDVILCRNLAIYLTDTAVGELWHFLLPRLRPGGRLIVGKAERPVGISALTLVGPCTYERRS